MDNEKLSRKLEENLAKIQEIFKDCPDVILKEAYLQDKTRCYCIYIDGIVDTNLMQRDFIKNILLMKRVDFEDKKNLLNIPLVNMRTYERIEEITNAVLLGDVIFILDNIKYGLSCNLVKVDKRSIDEPQNEKNVKGAHDGFIEDLNTNVAILRRKIKCNKLKFKSGILGTITNQKFVIAYIEGISNPNILNKLYERVNSIDFDGLIGIGYIEQFIADFPNSPFPEVQTTERPDKVVASLLEGKLVVILDGTPVTLIAPIDFLSFFQAVDDYTNSWIIGSFTRQIRIWGAIIAVFLPALYIAVVSYHYYMVPMNLLIPLAESRAKVPFPPIIEALIMEITIEMLREASIRLPTYIGGTISVVGGLVIGQAAVQAGIVSNVLIIVVALTAIASFVIPNQDMGHAIRLTRFIVMIFSAIFGIVGIVIGAAIIFAHLVALESLGEPYLKPIVPFKGKDIKDSVIRFPIRFLKLRPDTARPVDRKRGRNNEK